MRFTPEVSRLASSQLRCYSFCALLLCSQYRHWTPRRNRPDRSFPSENRHQKSQIGQSRLDVEAPPLTLPTLSSRSFHFSFDFYYQLGATSAPYHLSEEQFASIGTAPPPEVIARLIRKRVVRAFQAQPNSTTQQNFSKREAMVKAANKIRL